MQPSLDRVFQALANPTRRAMLDRLKGGEASVNDLAAPFALSQPTISAHLKILEAAGLVTRSRLANSRPVRLDPLALANIDHWLGPYRQIWEQRLDQLETYARTLQEQDRTDDQTNA